MFFLIIFYNFEFNVCLGIIFGIVGVGGIGFIFFDCIGVY